MPSESPQQARFHGRNAIAKELTETNRIFKNITIKINKVESTEKGTILRAGEWTADMQTPDGKVMPVKGLSGVTGEMRGNPGRQISTSDGRLHYGPRQPVALPRLMHHR